MKRIGFFLVLLATLLSVVYVAHAQSDAPLAIVMTADGPIMPAMREYIKRGVETAERRNAEAYFGRADDGMHWSFVRAAQGSVASLSVVPLQDVIGLGSEARMNTPSLNGGNWRWRLQPGALTHELAAKLALLAEVTDRLPQPLPVPPVEEFAA